MEQSYPTSVHSAAAPVARRRVGTRAAWRRDLGAIPPALLVKRHRGRSPVTRTVLPAFAD